MVGDLDQQALSTSNQRAMGVSDPCVVSDSDQRHGVDWNQRAMGDSDQRAASDSVQNAVGVSDQRGVYGSAVTKNRFGPKEGSASASRLEKNHES